MEAFGLAALFGLILGFMFGVGCAAAVLYTIFMGGYKRAIQDALLGGGSARYTASLEKVKHKLARQAERASSQQGAIK